MHERYTSVTRQAVRGNMEFWVFDTQHTNNIPMDSPEHGDHHDTLGGGKMWGRGERWLSFAGKTGSDSVVHIPPYRRQARHRLASSSTVEALMFPSFSHPISPNLCPTPGRSRADFLSGVRVALIGSRSARYFSST